jgi:hypothetical protein
MDTPRARLVFDFRFGGPFNVLAVDVRPYEVEKVGDVYKRVYGRPWARQFWVVDYDRWRDEHWTEDRAREICEQGCRSETPIVMSLFPHEIAMAAEYVKASPCHLCKSFACMTLREGGGGFEMLPNRPEAEQPHPRLAPGGCVKGHDMVVEELHCPDFEDVEP